MYLCMYHCIVLGAKMAQIRTFTYLANQSIHLLQQATATTTLRENRPRENIDIPRKSMHPSPATRYCNNNLARKSPLWEHLHTSQINASICCNKILQQQQLGAKIALGRTLKYLGNQSIHLLQQDTATTTWRENRPRENIEIPRKSEHPSAATRLLKAMFCPACMSIDCRLVPVCMYVCVCVCVCMCVCVCVCVLEFVQRV